MTRRLRPLWLLLPMLALIAASPASVPPDDLVRRGNEAAGRKDYPEALKLYEGAETRTTDPGLVAFNEGVVLYQHGDFGRAEMQFRLARQDATGRRQLWAAYDLAASLVQNAADSDVAKLTEAIGLFEECLLHDETDEHLAADARHNLELAKGLWVKARAQATPPKDQPPPDEDLTKPQPHKPEPAGQLGSEDMSAHPTRGDGDRIRVPRDPGKEPIQTDGQPSPGAGNLPVIPDRNELVPMSREDAEAHLRDASRKVLEEGRAHRQGSVRVPKGRVRDW